ncbi:hypothetical protein [Methylobacterium nodulans]|uniref:Uncharacterized protein n=1 Tax=Methylobacterium nodulans (strain LMG 21967 / CNCM I-2342 / ORS 2060) TaxID=460265 RepID=B8IIF9_METNO|nr:hypothetical protein [Methylobacterium nodulans]ACL59836.1 hypothetical protein Mnod_4979 [Methylobacterium nodulans ORS 2060]
MRVFDPEPFHAGFGIVVVPAPDRVEFCTEAASRGQLLPIRHSLAAALYDEEIARSVTVDEADVLEKLQAMAEMLDLAARETPAAQRRPRSRRR